MLTLITGSAAHDMYAHLAALVQQHHTHNKQLILVPDIFFRDMVRQSLTAQHIQQRVSVFTLPMGAYSVLRQHHTNGITNRHIISGVSHTLCVRSVVRSLAATAQLPLFGTVAHKAGFVAAIATFLREAQDALIAPATLATAHVTPYDTELATIYATYLTTLQQSGYADTRMLIALARDVLLATTTTIRYATCFFVGFDTFTPLYYSFLHALIDRIPHTFCLLRMGSGETHSPRPINQERAHTYAEMVRRFHPTLVNWDDKTPHEQSHHPTASAFTTLERHILNLNMPAPVAANGAMMLIEAADREREVRAVLRHVKTLLQRGVAAHTIALLFRSGEQYGSLLREIADEFAIPLALQQGIALREAPAAIALRMLLQLPLQRYSRRQLVEVWRSIDDGRIRIRFADDIMSDMTDNVTNTHTPATSFPALVWAALHPETTATTPLAPTMNTMAAIIDTVTREHGITGEARRIIQALHFHAAQHPHTPHPNDTQHAADAAEQQTVPTRFAPAAIVYTATLLEAFVAWLTPPKKALITEYIAWLHARVSFATTNDDHDRTKRSIQRLARVVAVLDDAVQRVAMPAVTYNEFVQILTTNIDSASFDAQSAIPESVIAMPLHAARMLRCDHVLLMGMEEGSFPVVPRQPLFYSRRERTILAQHHMPLPLPDVRHERSLLYDSVMLPRATLTLSRVYLDERGNPLPPSPYVDAIVDLFTADSVPRHMVRAGSVPTITAAASPSETLVAMMQHLRDDGTLAVQPATELEPVCVPHVTTITHTLYTAYQHAQQHAIIQTTKTTQTIERLLSHIALAWHIEQTRAVVTPPFGVYEGVVSDVKPYMQHIFGDEHMWSVTQFNDYILCPFRFLAAHVLRLRLRSEPVDGIDTSIFGRIYHDILAHAAQEWIATNVSMTAAHEGAVMSILNQAAHAVLTVAPTTYGIPNDHMWQWTANDMHRRLERVMRRVLTTSNEWATFRPIATEQAFGGNSQHPPLCITLPAGTIQVVGRIDRIDQRPQDGMLAIIDYKSNATPRPLKETLNATNVQLPLYILAIEQVIAPGNTVEQAAFLHLGSGTFSTPLTTSERQLAMDALYERLNEVVDGVRGGTFAVCPRDDCPSWCLYSSLCRVNVAKAEHTRLATTQVVNTHNTPDE